MPEYFYIVFTLYYIFVLLMWYGWGRIKKLQKPAGKSDGLFISVVIAVRNEAKNISDLIDDLARQSLSLRQFEIIIVDDRSEDATVSVVEKSLISHEKLNARIISAELHEDMAPKKAALLTGIVNAEGDIIVTTDGDCRVGSDWLEAIKSPFSHEKIMFVSGPVVIDEGAGLFSKMQSFEFTSLMGSGAAMIALGYPLMCNGANLAFRKTAFDKVGSYESVAHHATGDDVYLMQKIYAAFPGSAHFIKDQRAVIRTGAGGSLRDVVHQRRRWASKWNKHLLAGSWVLPVFLFVFYLSFLTALILPFYHGELMISMANVVIVKMVLDYFFLREVVTFSGLRMRFWLFLLMEVLYPFYVLFFGIAVHFGGWRWKGRDFKS